MELLVTVRRKILTPKSTIGALFIGGSHVCFTLEPPVRPGKPRAIPAGTYDLYIRFSNRFQRLMPAVRDVPGFEGILLHWGNRPEDTEGCLLVGKSIGSQPDWIGSSKAAFDDLFVKIQDACEWGDACITYVDVEAPPEIPA